MGILFVYRSPACVYRCIACCFIYILNVFCIHRLCASLSLSLSLYISTGPCLPGATRLRGIVYQSLFSYPQCFSTFNQLVINQLLINPLFAGLQVSNLVIGTGILDPLECHFTLHQAGCLNSGCPRGSPEIIKNPTCLQDTKKSEKCPKGHQQSQKK